MDLAGKTVYVAGHTGMVSSAIMRLLEGERCDIIVAQHGWLDLRDDVGVREYIKRAAPDVVFCAAAVVGGIAANAANPVSFLEDNLRIAVNVISASAEAGVGKLIFLGSSCIYPREAVQPIREDALLSGSLEPTNQWYAMAKIAGAKLCEAYRQERGCDFVTVMPPNLYGPGDNYDEFEAHVPAALLRRFHQAKVSGHEPVTVWGSGAARREFMVADDCADACVFVAKSDKQIGGIINAGFGIDYLIAEFAYLVADVVGYEGRIEFDTSKPEGVPQKLMDSSKLYELGWRPRVSLKDGLRQAYRWALQNDEAFR